MLGRTLRTVVGAAWLCAVLLFSSPAMGSNSRESQEETMLMFVGEDLEVLSIASRREESASQAPAVASVITRQEILDRGIRTLSQALEMVPGFYMAQKEWGAQPFFAGHSRFHPPPLRYRSLHCGFQ